MPGRLRGQPPMFLHREGGYGRIAVAPVVNLEYPCHAPLLMALAGFAPTKVGAHHPKSQITQKARSPKKPLIRHEAIQNLRNTRIPSSESMTTAGSSLLVILHFLASFAASAKVRLAAFRAFISAASTNLLALARSSSFLCTTMVAFGLQELCCVDQRTPDEPGDIVSKAGLQRAVVLQHDLKLRSYLVDLPEGHWCSKRR
ncbi:hypothetical protein N658DRAFT_254276 [Parathielavia hyrcaniae]|uniref:Uncharacterized protein n=1 Tax=Parathielavia hyrcaniae TaxID=113614 RepID=A0AAN6PUE9_9PEZI|nr:hypothetical protein N658DRAFT_254276 [Parathielavia hyrcaniae]